MDAWNAEDAFPFNVTSFTLQYDGFDVAAESTGATSALDTAGGRVHAYRSVAYTVDSLMERAAIPSMIAAGVLPPDGVPSLADLAGRRRARRRSGGAVFPEPAYNLSAIMAHITTPRELVLVATGPGPGPGDADPRRASLGFFALARDASRDPTGGRRVSINTRARTPGMCTTYAALEEICVKVRQNDDGAWGVDDTHGGVGCDPNTRWEPAKWRRCCERRASGRIRRFRRRDPRGGGSVVLRSGSDPLIAARNITGGSMFFAEVEAGRSAAGTIVLIVGFVVAVPGACLAWPFASRAARGAAVFRLGRAARTRRATDPDAFDNIL